jgi:LPXTG-site transpeptidase (sortase) family protein
MAIGTKQKSMTMLTIPNDWNRGVRPRFADAPTRGEVPTTGLMRPGPVGDYPEAMRKKGVTPVAMKIEPAQVDAQVEPAEIIQGKMSEPSGPYVVAWYEDTGRLGEPTNLVFAGHLDYYDVGEAVFFHLTELSGGDVITVTGDNDEDFAYSIDWVRTYTQDELDETAVKEIVGRTETEQITLITCSGPFDFDNGIYHDRTVVRGTRS